MGLAGLEPAASSLSEIDGRAPCYPAFPLVVLLRKSYKDGVNLSVQVQPCLLPTPFCAGLPWRWPSARCVAQASWRPVRHRGSGGGVDAAGGVGVGGPMQLLRRGGSAGVLLVASGLTGTARGQIALLKQLGVFANLCVDVMLLRG